MQHSDFPKSGYDSPSMHAALRLFTYHPNDQEPEDPTLTPELQKLIFQATHSPKARRRPKGGTRP